MLSWKRLKEEMNPVHADMSVLQGSGPMEQLQANLVHRSHRDGLHWLHMCVAPQQSLEFRDRALFEMSQAGCACEKGPVVAGPRELVVGHVY